MKRRTISGILLLSFACQLIYCLAMAVIIINQSTYKANAGASAEVAAVFSVPLTYIIFAVIVLFMQLVLILSFSNSMRFDHPTIWIETVSAVLYGGVFRVFYHYIPELEMRMAGSLSAAEEASRYYLYQLIQNLDWVYMLGTSLFLVGAGMTICFKKFVRYFLK